MTANTKVAPHIQAHQPPKSDSRGLRSPGLLAKWPMIGLLMALFGGLVFAGLTYNLVAQGRPPACLG